MPDAPAPIVSFTDLAVERDGILMLDSASGAVAPGRVLALTGHNGAGKTTLLRVLAGRVRPSEGTALVAGRTPDERDPRFRTALAALIGPVQTSRDMILDDHLRFIGATWGMDGPTGRERSAALMDALGIAHLARRYPHELSSGQTQLAALAMTLARPFDVLLLDEPEQRLDAERLGIVIDVLRGVVDRGAAIVLASHSPRLLEALADDRVVLSERA